MTFEELETTYNSLKEKNGFISSHWLYKNGHAQFYKDIKRLGLSWHEFLSKVDKDHPALQVYMDLWELKQWYTNLLQTRGKIVTNYQWMYKNYCRQMYVILHKLNLSWTDFKNLFGLKSRSPKHIKSLKELIKKYREVITEHGEKALKSEWLYKNGYPWVDYFSNKFIGGFTALKRKMQIHQEYVDRKSVV